MTYTVKRQPPDDLDAEPELIGEYEDHHVAVRVAAMEVGGYVDGPLDPPEVEAQWNGRHDPPEVSLFRRSATGRALSDLAVLTLHEARELRDSLAAEIAEAERAAGPRTGATMPESVRRGLDALRGSAGQPDGSNRHFSAADSADLRELGLPRLATWYDERREAVEGRR